MNMTDKLALCTATNADLAAKLEAARAENVALHAQITAHGTIINTQTSTIADLNGRLAKGRELYVELATKVKTLEAAHAGAGSQTDAGALWKKRYEEQLTWTGHWKNKYFFEVNKNKKAAREANAASVPTTKPAAASVAATPF